MFVVNTQCVGDLPILTDDEVMYLLTHLTTDKEGFRTIITLHFKYYDIQVFTSNDYNGNNKHYVFSFVYKDTVESIGSIAATPSYVQYLLNLREILE